MSYQPTTLTWLPFASVQPASMVQEAGQVTMSELTMSMGKLVKILGWYDNEWGYSNRMVDFMLYAGKKLSSRKKK